MKKYREKYNNDANEKSETKLILPRLNNLDQRLK